MLLQGVLWWTLKEWVGEVIVPHSEKDFDIAVVESKREGLKGNGDLRGRFPEIKIMLFYERHPCGWQAVFRPVDSSV